MEGWKESLSPEQQEKGIVKNAETFNDFVNKAIGGDSMLGRSITIPGVDATPEERTLFNDKVVKHSDSLVNGDDKLGTMMKWGLPESKDGYKVDPDREYSLTDDQISRFKEDSHNAAMTQDQFYAQLNTIDDRSKSMSADGKAASEAEWLSLDAEWGASKGDKIDSINAMLDLMSAPDSIKDAVKNKTMDADSVRFLTKIMESVKGESIQAAKDKSSGADLLPPPQAYEARTVVMDSEAYRDASHPMHASAKLRHLQLTDMVAGKKPSNEYGGPILQQAR
jgi:hypothetical protein